MTEFLAGVDSLDDDDINEKTGRRVDLECTRTFLFSTIGTDFFRKVHTI